jgi:hypothetical protein
VGGTTYTFTFDRENRLTAVTGGTVSASYVYDADGNRVKGTIGGVTTVYIAGLYEYQGGAITHYYGNGAMRRAGYAGGAPFGPGLIYVMQDQLQSSSLYVTRAGVLTQHNHYYPYGGNRAQRAPGGPFPTRKTKRFTGQYHEQNLPGVCPKNLGQTPAPFYCIAESCYNSISLFNVWDHNELSNDLKP